MALPKQVERQHYHYGSTSLAACLKEKAVTSHSTPKFWTVPRCVRSARTKSLAGFFKPVDFAFVGLRDPIGLLIVDDSQTTVMELG